MSRRGLYIAKNHGDIDKGETLFSSDSAHLQINMLPEDPHMDIVEINGGSAWVGLNGVPFYQKETLYTIPYNLPYIPELLVYLQAYAYDGSTTTYPAGIYAADVVVYSGAAGTVGDIIYAEIDRNEIRIVHEFENDTSGLAVPYTSDANRYTMRIKYYIISKDSFSTTGYSTGSL